MTKIQSMCLFAATLAFATPAAAKFAVNEVEGEHIDVSYDDRPLIRLMIANDTSDSKRAHETYKVYAHVMDPLDPKGERTITKGPGSQFTHHRGIFLGWSKAKVDGVGGADTWHMSGGVRQHFNKILNEDVTADRATLTVAVDWVKGDDVLLTEKRTFVVHKPEENGALLLDVESELTASAGDVQLNGDPEHAGVQYRAHEAVVANKSAKYLFPDGMKPGNKGDKDMPWAAMEYNIDDRKYHVQHMSHPSLPKGNIYSAYRDYGRFGSFFTADIPQGESKTFQVRFYISPGPFPDDAAEQMKERYAAYVQ